MLNLFFPQLCCGCNRRLHHSREVLCVHCLNRLPLIIPKKLNNNLFTQQFYGRIRLNYALSLLIFEREGLTQRLLHELKYKGKQQLGSFFGAWMGSIIKQAGPNFLPDVVMPVPLSKTRLRKRGYNQVSRFGLAIAKQLNIEFKNKVLIKSGNTTSQVFLKRSSRFKAKNQFTLMGNPEALQHTHILLVDDLVTTGATLESCAKVLLKIPGVSVSFATIAMA